MPNSAEIEQALTNLFLDNTCLNFGCIAILIASRKPMRVEGGEPWYGRCAYGHEYENRWNGQGWVRVDEREED